MIEMFSIRFTSNKSETSAYGDKIVRGSITLNSFTEKFESPISYWSICDYETQWEDAAKRLTSGATSSCLVTSMKDPSKANFLFWWPM